MQGYPWCLLGLTVFWLSKPATVRWPFMQHDTMAFTEASHFYPLMPQILRCLPYSSVKVWDAEVGVTVAVAVTLPLPPSL